MQELQFLKVRLSLCQENNHEEICDVTINMNSDIEGSDVCHLNTIRWINL